MLAGQCAVAGCGARVLGEQTVLGERDASAALPLGRLVGHTRRARQVKDAGPCGVRRVSGGLGSTCTYVSSLYGRRGAAISLLMYSSSPQPPAPAISLRYSSSAHQERSATETSGDFWEGAWKACARTRGVGGRWDDHAQREPTGSGAACSRWGGAAGNRAELRWLAVQGQAYLAKTGAGRRPIFASMGSRSEYSKPFLFILSTRPRVDPLDNLTPFAPRVTRL